MKILDVIKKNIRALIVLFIAFTLVGTVSFLLLSDILKKELSNNAGHIIDYTEKLIQSNLTELKVSLLNATITTQTILDWGGTFDDVSDYIISLTADLTERETGNPNFNIVYGYIYDEFVGRHQLEPTSRDNEYLDADGNVIEFIPQERVWYVEAMKVPAGVVVISKPYIDAVSGEITITASMQVQKHKETVGVLAIDVDMGRFTDLEQNSKLGAYGEGILFDADFNIVAHSNKGYVGLNYTEYGEYPRAIELLKQGKFIDGIHIADENENSSDVFGRKLLLEDGYYMLLSVTESQNNGNIYVYIFIVIAMGVLLISLLIFFFVKSESDKMKADLDNYNKSMYLARMSYEIREPMNAVIGMSEMILREEPPPGIYNNAVAIKNAGINLLSVLDNVQNFTDIESGTHKAEEEEYELSVVVNDVIEIIQVRLIKNAVRMMVDANPSLPSNFIGDPAKIRQIMLNLLSNAIEHTKTGSITLDLCYEQVDEAQYILIIKVIDTGVGIREEDLPKFFCKNNPHEVTIHDVKKSIGLGLSTVESFCRAMGGNIAVESKIGVGSAFTVRLPQKVKKYAPFAKVENIKDQNILYYGERRITAESIERSLKNLAVKHERVDDNLSLIRSRLGDFTHIFLPAFRYGNIMAELKEYSTKPEIVLFAELSETVAFRGVQTLTVPSHVRAVANAINGVQKLRSNQTNGVNLPLFVAPEAKILLVDDIAANLSVMEGLLSYHEIKPDKTTNGYEAIELVKSNQYDVIFMDHIMPEIDGIEATHKIRELKGNYFQTIPIVALTANVVLMMRETFLESGMNDFMAKPVEPAKLEDILLRWLPPEKVKERSDTSEQESNSAPNYKGETAFMTSMDRIPGVSSQRALAYAGGSKELLEKNVRTVMESMPSSADTLNNLVERDLSLYAIEVHNIKSMLANIGAHILSESAQEIEGLAKVGEKEACYILNLHFNQDISRLIKEMQRLVSITDGIPKPEGDAPLLCSSMRKISEAAELYDSALALEIINSLSAFSYGSNIDILLEKLAGCFERFDFDEATEIIGIIKQLNNTTESE